MPSRSDLARSIRTEEAVLLLRWFVESHDEGWLPVMESHVAGKSGRYTPFGTDALRRKAGELLTQLDKLDKQRGSR